MARTSGRLPMALDAAVTATTRVRSPITSSKRCAGSSPVSVSNSAQRTVAPARWAAMTQGRMLASWSSEVTTISSPAGPPAREGVGDVEGERRHVGSQHHPIGRAVDEVGDRAPGLLHDRRAALARRKDAVHVGHPVAQGRRDRLDDRAPAPASPPRRPATPSRRPGRGTRRGCSSIDRFSALIGAVLCRPGAARSRYVTSTRRSSGVPVPSPTRSRWRCTGPGNVRVLA